MLKRVRHPDQPVSFFSEWLDNIKAFHEFVFVTIESAVIVGALQYATAKTQSVLLLALWVLAWIAMSLFVTGYVRLALHAAYDRYATTRKWRRPFLWLSGLSMLAVFLLIPWVIQGIVDAIVANGILQ